MADAPSKLASHIMAGEPHLTNIEALMQAALALADHITDSMHAALKAQHGKATPCAGDGLNAVLDTVNDHVGELRSWWRQLHELAVVQARESRHG